MSKSINDTMNTLAGELPSGYIVTISVENGSGWVEWDCPECISHSIEISDSSMEEQALEALRQCKEHAGD